MATYQLLEEWMDYEELGSFHTYGVKVTEGNDALVFHDISTKKERVARFLRVLEEGRVSFCHIMDVLEDFMASDFEAAEDAAGIGC